MNSFWKEHRGPLVITLLSTAIGAGVQIGITVYNKTNTPVPVRSVVPKPVPPVVIVKPEQPAVVPIAPVVPVTPVPVPVPVRPERPEHPEHHNNHHNERR